MGGKAGGNIVVLDVLRLAREKKQHRLMETLDSNAIYQHLLLWVAICGRARLSTLRI